MAPYDWNTIRSNIFAGESGGDYNALFGYANRPDGAFAGTNLTGMTVDQALQFSDPSGPYGQWVKDRIGRVATPMGAYQVVGKTLRAAKQGLGLSGNEMMTPETQERIGKWIYETQGTGAWAGYRPDAGARRLAADTMGAIGAAGKGAPMAGLLGDQPQQKSSVWDKIGFLADPDKRARLAMALEGMTLRPNQALMQSLGEGIMQRRELATSTAQANKTAAWLRAQGRDDLASAVEQGVLGGKDAASLYYTPAKDSRTALQQNYEYAIAQGMTPDQARQWVSNGTTINMPGTPQIGTIPPNYEVYTDPATGQRAMRPIPGSPAQTTVAADKRLIDAQIATADDSLGLINSVMADPALAQVTGMVQGRLPPLTQAGTDLNVKIDQLKGQVFLQAFNSLRGAGAITEREGAAAQAAIARLDRAQSTDAFTAALTELRDIVERGKQRLQSGSLIAPGADQISGQGGVTVGEPY